MIFNFFSLICYEDKAFGYQWERINAIVKLSTNQSCIVGRALLVLPWWKWRWLSQAWLFWWLTSDFYPSPCQNSDLLIVSSLAQGFLRVSTEAKGVSVLQTKSCRIIEQHPKPPASTPLPHLNWAGCIRFELTLKLVIFILHTTSHHFSCVTALTPQSLLHCIFFITIWAITVSAIFMTGIIFTSTLWVCFTVWLQHTDRPLQIRNRAHFIKVFNLAEIFMFTI